MTELNPITREEKIIAGEKIEPITRMEKLLAGEDLKPITRLEHFVKKYRSGGTGGDTGGDTGGGETNGGAVSAPRNDVMFIDYDGTILYSYTVEEAQALTELPPLPQHEGLICQGWNWSLEDIKELNRDVTVGATYITDDGKTRIYISLQKGRTSPMLGVCPNGTVTVDWGDGTEPDILTGTSTTIVKWTPTHEYASAGDYVIKLTVDGTMGFSGANSTNQYSAILRFSSGADARNTVYQNLAKKIEIGNNVTSIGTNAFYFCYSLSSIIISESVTSIGTNAFRSCYSLSSITIPESVTTIGTYTFQSCDSLSSITIPESVTSIGTNAFQSCNSLSSITIPESVTSIGTNAFHSCQGVRYYDFTKHTRVPTLSNTNAFTNIPSDCEILVPSALYDEWIAATNWSTYADKIVAR